MKHTIKTLLVSGLLLSMPYAYAAQDFFGQAELATPVAQPMEKTVKKVTWRCEGARCTASAAKISGVESFIRRCRHVSEAVGPLKSFSIVSEGRGLSASQSEIATCNRLAHGK
jgi:hypothetical protein